MTRGNANPIQIGGEELEVIMDLILLGSNVHKNYDYSHETKRQLLLERKITTNLTKCYSEQI